MNLAGDQLCQAVLVRGGNREERAHCGVRRRQRVREKDVFRTRLFGNYVARRERERF